MLDWHGVFDFVACFRAIGWRWPLRLGDEVEVFHGLVLVATLPAKYVLDRLSHDLDTLALQVRLERHVQALRRPPVMAPPRILSPISPDRRAAYRAQRKARRRA